MNTIDFRSDTVSWPTDAMRAAMAAAPIGDDVYGEDPTVNELERLAAEMLGFEAGLYVSSGTQGNLISILAHANRGDEAIVGDGQHTYNYEAGGMAVLGGIVPRILPQGDNGEMSLDAIEAAIRPNNDHFPTSRLILLENTAGGRYGAAVSLDYLAGVRDIADRHDVIVHLDGARLFNAVAKMGIDVKQITQHVDSVSVCLSKGLCAPVGSVVVGSADFIHKARRARKLVGGGMRQAGFMAAAGIVALKEMTLRLDEDHASAQRLAQGLAQIPGIDVALEKVHTNMVFFALTDEVSLDAPTVGEQLRERYGIHIGVRSARTFRCVTHYWVGAAEVDQLLDGLREILGSAEMVLAPAAEATYYG